MARSDPSSDPCSGPGSDPSSNPDFILSLSRLLKQFVTIICYCTLVLLLVKHKQGGTSGKNVTVHGKKNTLIMLICYTGKTVNRPLVTR